jgi:hypothetical protein
MVMSVDERREFVVDGKRLGERLGADAEEV